MSETHGMESDQEYTIRCDLFRLYGGRDFHPGSKFVEIAYGQSLLRTHSAAPQYYYYYYM